MPGPSAASDANWSPAVQQEYAAVIEEEADRLNELIDNLLEASRLQSGTFKLDLTDEVLLPKLAADTVRKFETQTDKHQLRSEIPPEFPPVFGDERRLTQVLNNLVGNAIKYSPDGGAVIVSGAVHSDYVTVSVRDEGIGIPSYQQHRIFEKFSRLDNALSRKAEGTGLGLYLAKAIVEAHDGRIWFTNNCDVPDEEEGCPGTTFTFSLPRHRPEG